MAGSGRLSHKSESHPFVLRYLPFGWISLGALAFLAILLGLLSLHSDLSSVAQLIAP
jgi:hypothetical protein